MSCCEAAVSKAVFHTQKETSKSFYEPLLQKNRYSNFNDVFAVQIFKAEKNRNIFNYILT